MPHFKPEPCTKKQTEFREWMQNAVSSPPCLACGWRVDEHEES